MRAVLIINPISGDRVPNTEKVSIIQERLARAPFVAEVCLTTEDRGAAGIAREAVADGVEVVLVGGGDGTVGEVARELVRTPATLGILPMGTFNNIARSIGVLGDLREAAEVIAAGHVREIDVGLANEEHYFFEAVGAGLDAALFPVGEEIKGGRWTRIVDALRLAMKYRPQCFTITFDRSLAEIIPLERQTRMSARSLSRKSVRRNALFVTVANGQYYGSGFTVAAEARLRDGLLTLSIYRRFSKWELLRHFISISKGKRRYSPKIEIFHSAEMRISSRRAVPVHIDGQPLGTTPIRLRTLPRALRVFAPETAAAGEAADRQSVRGPRQILAL